MRLEDSRSILAFGITRLPSLSNTRCRNWFKSVRKNATPSIVSNNKKCCQLVKSCQDNDFKVTSERSLSSYRCRKNSSYSFCYQRLKRIVSLQKRVFAKQLNPLNFFYSSSLAVFPLLLSLSSTTSGIRCYSLQKFLEAFEATLLARVKGRTFFVTALLATRYDPLLVISGCVAALVITSMLAYFVSISGLEEVLYLVPFSWVHYGAVILFLGFGAQLIRYSDRLSEEEEHAIESQELIGAESQMKTFKGDIGEEKTSNIFLQILGMTILSEWCGNAMSTVMSISTIHNVLPVLSGVILSNIVSTTLIVFLVWLLMRKLSAKRATNVSGITLIGLALFYLFRGPSQS
ncbi:uncharacterized protein Gasu_52330 [Galdieria sulphuraria]|uniref:GDT1 family protein n=1 Tax=Galdieria sulphuraria TaxID=130081 RepID=M2WTA0_GALSU|nr:uncharacterized protein Gasu_52330 [Galdieria sulphuraria]EME27130.1 hypothetical protein Gasu_52330 [Galdieria sulphuraria]|eukprot:XP_005703650.1 hypothetical protein Gasu_52330 [Galdieria sulphuraria]